MSKKLSTSTLQQDLRLALRSTETFLDNFLLYLKKQHKSEFLFYENEPDVYVKYSNINQLEKFFEVITGKLYTDFIINGQIVSDFESRFTKFKTIYTWSYMELQSGRGNTVCPQEIFRTHNDGFEGVSKKIVSEVINLNDYNALMEILNKDFPRFLALYDIFVTCDRTFKVNELTADTWKFGLWASGMWKVPPKIPLPKNVNEQLYVLQQNNMFTDFEIHTKQSIVRVHRLIMYINGGDHMKTLLNSQVCEGKNAVISLDTFDDGYVHQYVKYIYLNEINHVGLSIEYLLKLYELAHHLKNNEFRAYLENLINFGSRLSDILLLYEYSRVYTDLVYLIGNFQIKL